MKIANAMKADRSEEMGLEKKKTSNVFEVPRSTIKIKLNRYRETDQYPSWSETSVTLQSRRRTLQLLSDDGAEIFWANNKNY